MVADVLGAPVKRVEDPKFITGKGRYLDDIKLPGMVHVVHPPQPVRAREHPLDRHQRGEGRPGRHRGDRRRRHPVQPAADGVARRRRVGDPEQRQHADDPRQGLGQVDGRGRRRGRRRDAGPGAGRARPDPGRLGAAARGRGRREGDPAGRAAAPRERPQQRRVRVERRRQGRAPTPRSRTPRSSSTSASSTTASSRTRWRSAATSACTTPGTDEYTIWMSSQTPHIQRLLLTAFVTGVPEHKVRVISPDVGGAFGSKIFCYADMALVMFASKLIGGRPVKWVEGRRESYGSHDPRPRPHHVRGHRREQAGRGPGPARQDVRQPRRPAVDDRPRHPDDALRAASSRARTSCPTSTPRSPACTRTRPSWTRTAAPAGPEATYVVERSMDLVARRAGHRPGRGPAAELPAARQLPVRQPVGAAHRGQRLQAVHRLRQLRAGDGQGARDGRLHRPRGDEGRGEGPRQAARPRPVDLHRGVRRRPLEVDRRGRRGLGRRDVGVVQHPGPPDRQGRRHDGHPEPRPGPRDDVLADHQPRAGHPDGGHRRPAQRHPGHAVRLRLVRLPDVERRHRRRAQGGRQDPREGEAATRRTCSRPRSRTSRSRAPSTASRAAPTRRRRSRRSRSRSTWRSTRPRAWSRTSTRRPTTTPRTARSRSAPTSRSSRWTRRPGTSTSCATSPSTTWARRSTR